MATSDIDRPEHTGIPYTAVSSLGRGRVLVLAPHPDDEVLGCAGAILAHLGAGDPVQVCIATDGEYPVTPAQSRPDYGAVRRAESLNAARALGCAAPEFWGLPDGGLRYGEPLVATVADALVRHPADLLYLPSTREIHPDHLALAHSGLEAARRHAAPLQVAMYEIGAALRPNRLLDITALMERKRQAIGCFESQLAAKDYGRFAEALNTYRAFTLPESVRYAEGYRLLSGVAEIEQVLRQRADAGSGQLQSENRDLERDPAPLRTRSEPWHREQGALQERLARVQAENARLQEQLQRQQAREAAQRAAFEATLDDLYRSWSWRLTAPLRFIGRFFL